MNAYQQWWDTEGSAMRPHNNEDCEEFARRMTKIAWSNAKFVENQACAMVADASVDYWVKAGYPESAEAREAMTIAQDIRDRGLE